jgi:hypothetical protein
MHTHTHTHSLSLSLSLSLTHSLTHSLSHTHTHTHTQSHTPHSPSDPPSFTLSQYAFDNKRTQQQHQILFQWKNDCQRVLQRAAGDDVAALSRSGMAASSSSSSPSHALPNDGSSPSRYSPENPYDSSWGATSRAGRGLGGPRLAVSPNKDRPRPVTISSGPATLTSDFDAWSQTRGQRAGSLGQHSSGIRCVVCLFIRLIYKSQVSLFCGGSVTKYSRTGVSVAMPHRVKMGAAPICLMTD